MRIKGVILDVDGTLVDSNGLHAQAWVEAFRAKGYDVPLEKARRLVGEGSDQLIPDAVGLAADSPEAKALAEERSELFRKKYLPKVQALPGAGELLRRFHEEGLKLVVATSAKDEELGPLLAKTGAAELIDAKTTADDAENSKPAPDIVQAAVETSRLRKEDLVMLGDTPYDIAAARKAGVKIIAFESGGWKRDELGGAVAVYAGPEALLAGFEQQFDL